MKGHNDSAESIIAITPVVDNSMFHGTTSREDMGLRKCIPNVHSPMPFEDTEFPGDIILDKIGIVTNSKASSCIGVMAKAEVGLDKDAMIGSMDAEDGIPISNCSITAIRTRQDMA